MQNSTLAPRLRNCRVESLKPFGALIQPLPPAQTVMDLCMDSLYSIMRENRLLVFRGFSSLTPSELVAFAKSWGEILVWDYGEILDVLAHPNPKNYIFTPGKVPFHWDGAFHSQTPHYQLFQCLQASGTHDGGDTLFCNTVQLLQNLPDRLRERWEGITIKYSTEKVAHYGGTVIQPLLALSPTGEEVLRYGEPADKNTSDLNPFFLEVDGVDYSEVNFLIKEINTALYHPEVCYSHQWQQGDILIADNFSLLHGRNAYNPEASRHLQRVHIL